MTLHGRAPRQNQRHRTTTDTSARPKLRHAFILGFCLSVLMTSGTGYALALWHQNATLTMLVVAGTLPSPQITCTKIPNETAVLVTWTPQRAGATGYDITVTEDGQTIRTRTLSTNTSEKISAPTGILSAYSNIYAVTVTAHYGPWQAAPTSWNNIKASKSLLSSATITCQ